MNQTTWTTHEAKIFNFGTPAWDKNEIKAIEQGFEPCSACGRGVKEGHGWTVHTVFGTNSIFLAETEWDRWETNPPKDGADMGYWTLGPECGKKLPAKFRRSGHWSGHLG